VTRWSWAQCVPARTSSTATLGVGSMLRQDESWARRGGVGRDGELGLHVTASWDLAVGRVIGELGAKRSIAQYDFDLPAGVSFKK
jgi:hypothetical protein